MSIDKEGTGLPEVNVHKPSTQVNLGVIVGVLVFLVLGAIGIFWVIRKTGVTNPGQGTVEKR